MKLATLQKKIIISFLSIISFSYTVIASADNLTTRLDNYTYLGEFSSDNAKLAMQNIAPLNTLDFKYSLDLYKIRYRTPAPDGKLTFASGFVAMPIDPINKVSIVSFQHGTRVTRTDVPSNFQQNYYMYPAVFSSSGGYMLVMPDYLGLGDSTLALHPYVQAKTLASSSIDMLIAAKELAKRMNYPLNDKLFLAGYSEGGYSTTVMYESLLKKHKDIPVTAAAPGSAPYDWNETIHFVVDTPGPRASAYLALFFYSMQTYFHYWDSIDVIFKQPYNAQIPVLFDGKHEMADILQALPADPRQMIDADFLKGIMDATDPHSADLIASFNHYSFTATSPFLLVGTKGDHDVPYHGAEIAYAKLSHRSDKVFIKHVSDVLDHVQAGPFVIKEQLDFFNQYN